MSKRVRFIFIAMILVGVFLISISLPPLPLVEVSEGSANIPLEEIGAFVKGLGEGL